LGTLVGVVVFAITQTIKLTTYKNLVDHRLENIEALNKAQEKKIEILTDHKNKHDVVLMEIKTKLASIEAMLTNMNKRSK
jgi:peptidoglycan hydrolase CwlO-like protein